MVDPRRERSKLIRMTEVQPRGYDTYNLVVHLLNLQDQNLPPFKEARVQRIASTKKIINLIKNCKRTAPLIPPAITSLSIEDPEWDDQMIYPKINHVSLFLRTGAGFGWLFWYGYNYPILNYNKRFRFIRYCLPLICFCGFAGIYRYFFLTIVPAITRDSMRRPDFSMSIATLEHKS